MEEAAGIWADNPGDGGTEEEVKEEEDDPVGGPAFVRGGGVEGGDEWETIEKGQVEQEQWEQDEHTAGVGFGFDCGLWGRYLCTLHN